MHTKIAAYHKKTLLTLQSFEAHSIGQIKEHVNWASKFATHVDVYMGPQPVKFQTRVRRVKGYWYWLPLEKMVQEAATWPA